MEILAACQAIDLRGDKGMGKATQAVYDIIRSEIPMLTEDRIMNVDINKVTEIMKSESLIKAAEEKIGTIL